ncbi:microsomal glutathione S-transferase 2-like [Acanthaster planci]|uniref:Microsomal glutathione S-transferase 2-like n=1 Tax=Acanthaster planci TaxID=133434 RepID=A0A8B7Z6E3_ACAPL|nr:microsomal glutathione S-transferase 2-like [Acanthaster planci]
MSASTLSLLLRDEEMIFPAIVSLMHALQMAVMAKAVGGLRGKFKISPPATSGDPGFERGLRAQQNTLEFSPIFLILLWVSAKYLNPVLASLTALLYLKARSDYFSGYCASAEKRLRPFKRSVLIIQVLLLYSAIGLIHTALTAYFNINIPQKVGLDKYIPLGKL